MAKTINHKLQQPLCIGITGGIGSGKSYICHQLEKAGHKLFYCDNVAKQIIRNDEYVKQQLQDIVGPEVYSQDGTLRKSVLAEYLCRGNDYSARVNAVVHPCVAKKFLQTIESMALAMTEQKTHVQNSSLHPFALKSKTIIELNDLLHLQPGTCIFMECALLFEAHFEKLVDTTILIHTDKETQISRVMQRDNVTREKALEWIDLQLPEKEKMQRADFILLN